VLDENIYNRKRIDIHDVLPENIKYLKNITTLSIGNQIYHFDNILELNNT
jgi:hypothetical protein